MAGLCRRWLACLPFLVAVPIDLYTWQAPHNTWILKVPFRSVWPVLVAEPPPDMRPLPLPANHQSLALPAGARMPMSGIGLCCRVTAVGRDVYNTVLWFLLSGGRHLDTAEGYLNHREVGQAVREAMRRGVPREEIFVTTKLLPMHYGARLVDSRVPSMLRELGLDYVDLLLMHAPGVPSKVVTPLGLNLESCGPTPRECRRETWLALAKHRERGLVRNLGVSNFGPRQMEDIASLNSAPIAVNQLEFHPWVPEPHRKAVEWCHRHGVAVTAYCSVGGPETSQKVLRRSLMKKLGAAHGRTGSQALLRWAVQSNISVIPGTSSVDHMKENLDIFGFRLTEEEMALLDSEEQNKLLRSRYVEIPDEFE